ncbi:MAG TPA: hypothetical protein VGF87_04365 [Acidimicrobiales bacterium]|jgi:hypothetical protein
MSAVVRALKAFGKFWWDFIIGDTPEVAVAVAVLIGLCFLLRSDRVVASVLLPLLAAGFLLASAWRGRKRQERTPADAD